jgi:ABC-type uncharacterized transport system involved in gliding motility auxiliary subunit
MNKKFETYLYSTVGVIAMLLILLAVNVIAGGLRQRIDLTAEKAYTLSPGTKAILGKLDTKVKVRFYCTRGENEMPVVLKTYAQRVEDLLAEYKQFAKGKLEVEKLNPRPDSDAEDSANLDGVEGQMIQTGEKIYLGVAVSCLDQKVALPFLSPDRERYLEYDLSRAISRAGSTARATVGVMSAIPVFGQPMNPMMARMGQQGQPAWTFISELKRDFEVKQVEMTAEEIDPEIKVLVVVHPRDITEKTQFAIDQFIMRGGKLIAFVDPASIIDSRQTGGSPMMPQQPTSSSLDRLFKAWGVEMDKTRVIADMKFLTRMNRGNRPDNVPTVLSINQRGINKDDVITAQIDNVLMLFAGGFSGTPSEGLKKTVLMHTTEESQLVESFLAQLSSEQIAKEFKSDGKQRELAIRLTGKFKTSFPEGKPADPAAAADKKDDKKSEALKESKDETAVILVADADMLADQFCVRVQDFFGQRIVQPLNANLTLVQNFVEQLSGDSNLIGTRSRASLNRPFTLVRDMQAKAEESYRAKIKGFEENLQKTQSKLNELQRNKDKSQRFILSPEQQKEIENLRKDEARMKKDLKDERKNLRRDIDSLENRIKWLNIAGMPLLVTLSGITLALLKRQRTAAK